MEREIFCPACRMCGMGDDCEKYETCAEWRAWFGARWRATRALFGMDGAQGEAFCFANRGEITEGDLGGAFGSYGRASERIMALKQGDGRSWRVLSELCGMSKNSLIRYARGERVPSADAIVRIAECFGVTAEFLLGR